MVTAPRMTRERIQEIRRWCKDGVLFVDISYVKELLAECDALEAERDEAQRKAKMEFGDLLHERDSLKAEVELARERLGPAGYKILQDFLILQTRVSELEAALTRAMNCIDKHATLHATDDFVASGLSNEVRLCQKALQREAKDTGEK